MIKKMEELDLRGRATFIRVDFNVPLSAAGKVTDDTRIRAALPTIHLARTTAAPIILASHLGRPKRGPDRGFSLQPAGSPLP